MNVEELKRMATSLSEEERIWLAAYLKHLSQVDSPAHKAELSAADRRIGAGDFVTLDKVERVHAALKAEGL
ncbi:MAG: hypothetical protein H0V56_00190 [Chthoniobacterales bacterium]|nr:hypothetical protein [Chthoniobacterales bacterium]